jgi:hypothetical protein
MTFIIYSKHYQYFVIFGSFLKCILISLLADTATTMKVTDNTGMKVCNRIDLRRGVRKDKMLSHNLGKCIRVGCTNFLLNKISSRTT